jgi:hypothetical protein
VRDEKEGWESARTGARGAGIYTSGRAGGRRQSGEAGCVAGALPEVATPNLNGRTPCLHCSRQTRAGRERRKSRPACRLIVYSTGAFYKRPVFSLLWVLNHPTSNTKLHPLLHIPEFQSEMTSSEPYTSSVLCSEVSDWHVLY